MLETIYNLRSSLFFILFFSFTLSGAAQNPAADLDQCANGGVGDPPIQCTGSAWQNGNLNHNQAHYLEGGSVPYRMRFTGLMPGTIYTVTIEWDTTENSDGSHALDYLTSYNRTESNANPCSGITGCVLAAGDTFPIPPDPNVTAGNDGIPGNSDDINQVSGNFTLFGGQILSVSGYTVAGAYATGSQTSITITFRATANDPVLAWGGHISTRLDWGVDHSAIAIDGSPYHMRLIDLNGSGGNQDRGLSSSATIFPGTIKIIKDARPNTSWQFDFTATGPDVFDFSLIDNGTSFNNIRIFQGLTNFGNANNVTVTEASEPSVFNLSNISCVSDSSGGSGSDNNTVSIDDRFVIINLEEGEYVTCTFVNTLLVPTASYATISGRVSEPNGRGLKGATIYLTDQDGTTNLRATSNVFGYYNFAEVEVGRSYLLRVTARGFAFSPETMIISLVDDVQGADFLAQRIWSKRP